MSIVSFKAKSIIVEDTRTGRRRSLFVECGADGVLVVVDADSDIPSFVERRTVSGFPTDEAVLKELEAVLKAPLVLIEAAERGVELDDSARAGLKKMPVDIFDNVYVGETKRNALVLCVDIRNFSDFLCCNDEDDVFKLIREFTSNLLSCVNQYGFGCSYYKLMGDGAIVIWDEATDAAVEGALAIFDTYTAFANEELFKPYRGLGLAGALVVDQVYKYEISAEASQLKYRDYVGYGINLACRLQTIALKDELIINNALASRNRIPVKACVEPAVIAELQVLKGLKDEDRKGILIYERL